MQRPLSRASRRQHQMLFLLCLLVQSVLLHLLFLLYLVSLSCSQQQGTMDGHSGAFSHRPTAHAGISVEIMMFAFVHASGLQRSCLLARTEQVHEHVWRLAHVWQLCNLRRDQHNLAIISQGHGRAHGLFYMGQGMSKTCMRLVMYKTCILLDRQTSAICSNRHTCLF